MGTQDYPEQATNFSLGTKELNDRISDAIQKKEVLTPLEEWRQKEIDLNQKLDEGQFTEADYADLIVSASYTRRERIHVPTDGDKVCDGEIGLLDKVCAKLPNTVLAQRAYDRANNLRIQREERFKELSATDYFEMLKLFDSADYNKITSEMISNSKKYIQTTWLEPISNCAPSQEFSAKKLGTQAYENFVYMQAKLAREGVLEVPDFIEDVERLLQMKQDYNAPLSELEKELSKEFYVDLMKFKESGMKDNEVLQSFVDRLQIGALHFLEGKSDKRFEVRDTYSNWRIPIRMFIQEILERSAYDGKPIENRDIENNIARQIALGNNEAVLSALQAYSNLTNPNYNPKSN